MQRCLPFGEQAFVAVTEPVDALDAVTKPQLKDDSSDDVIQPWTKSPAGDDSCTTAFTVEEHAIARASEFEGRGVREGRCVALDLRQAVVDEYFVGGTDEEHGPFAEVMGNGRLKRAGTKVSDSNIGSANPFLRTAWNLVAGKGRLAGGLSLTSVVHQRRGCPQLGFQMTSRRRKLNRVEFYVSVTVSDQRLQLRE